MLELQLVVGADVPGGLAQRIDQRCIDQLVRCGDLVAGDLERRALDAGEGFAVASDGSVALTADVVEDAADLLLDGEICAEQCGVRLADGVGQHRLAEGEAAEQGAAALRGAEDDPHERYSFMARRARTFESDRYSRMRSSPMCSIVSWRRSSAFCSMK